MVYSTYLYKNSWQYIKNGTIYKNGTKQKRVLPLNDRQCHSKRQWEMSKYPVMTMMCPSITGKPSLKKSMNVNR